VLKRLETAGLVHRERRSDDERSVEVALTVAGEAMRSKAADVPAQFSCALGPDADAQAELRDTLKALTESISTTGA
jgi:MarR family transcriptional regulator, organic hydroperoxide resistance regulator